MWWRRSYWCCYWSVLATFSGAAFKKRAAITRRVIRNLCSEGTNNGLSDRHFCDVRFPPWEPCDMYGHAHTPCFAWGFTDNLSEWPDLPDLIYYRGWFWLKHVNGVYCRLCLMKAYTLGLKWLTFRCKKKTKIVGACLIISRSVLECAIHRGIRNAVQESFS